ncbi:PLP-dependent cysteine synthase family protein [Jatrophihabitans telluris]|uniref:L-cysteine desulfhydrase Cds1 n=1 Tax=Jatrophihabitans telluris TaxID=2038343 RepID=A0ABY4R269_9ACTN|nr:PLP-dependent cysteine synthase family protein [Jatrophihabitans telluris]UQX89915.1 PLP-dependent cysteine synthase family protein [Jatrophihabitans telluris]
MRDIERTSPSARAWSDEAIRRVEADANRSADTHLIRFELPTDWGIDLYFKDESTHPTGSLKHRLARSLFLYAVANGWLKEGMPVIEASSGSTAVSEAYFARLLDLPFVAVMPRTTSANKIALIERQGGRCHLVSDATMVYAEAARLAEESGGHYIDQFTYAERATDWRGNNNIAESILAQLRLEPHPVPSWVVVGAGTGGTSATIGRYIRYRRLATRLCVVDVENSAFMPGWQANSDRVVTGVGSRIEGIGRPRVEPSFIGDVVDRMIGVSDAASIAAMRYLQAPLGRRVGASTGTNFVGALAVAAGMRERGERGSIVTLICDGGERYADTYYSAEWLSSQGLDPEPHRRHIEAVLAGQPWPETSVSR